MPSSSNLPDAPRDTSPLDPEQLSDQELMIMFEIENRLAEARNVSVDTVPKGGGSYLATVQNRYPRVLLLDGGRGTGKTSLLLTLVKRWHYSLLNDEAGAKRISTAYSHRIQKITSDRPDRVQSRLAASVQKPIPDNVKVLDILDFDPLPPEMPLIAGIIQAWRPLAEAYDETLGAVDDGYGEKRSLMDRWYGLFGMAAAGWGKVSQEKSLVEQVLDRQDQVENWQRLGDDWASFVKEVFIRGKKLPDNERLNGESVFVIMIDDCDLQVGRIRQLLPALRMLYHPKVFFLVAADRRHMIEMLQLDFFGQQSALAQHNNANPAPLWDLVHNDRWASELAYSSVDKVFPKANRWKLNRLTLREFLAFPGKITDFPNGAPRPHLRAESQQDSFTFYDYLDSLKCSPGSASGDSSAPPQSAGELILNLARRAGRIFPGVMTYRSAQQLLQHAMRIPKEERAAAILARLISENEDEDQAVVHHKSSLKDSSEPITPEATTEIVEDCHSRKAEEVPEIPLNETENKLPNLGSSSI